jgi:pimeloyl-ACP methyl ester carboxylesterase
MSAACETRWVDVDGPVHYADFGGPADGPLVVCVHGLGASYTSWLSLGPLLARRARVVAVDLAGFGRTLAGERRTDVAANRRLLSGFLAAVSGGRPVLLVGNSMGGMISVLQAAAEPGSVAGLVLLSPALPLAWRRPPGPVIIGMFAGMVLPKVGTTVLARRRARCTPEEIIYDALRRTTIDPARVPADAVAEMVALTSERMALPGVGQAHDVALVAATRSVVRQVTVRGGLAAAVAAVAAPTLLVHGRADRLVPVAAIQRVAASRPDWQVELLDDCGHLPQLEALDRTAALIDGWLDGPGAGALAAAAPGAAADHPGGGAGATDVPTSRDGGELALS